MTEEQEAKLRKMFEKAVETGAGGWQFPCGRANALIWVDGNYRTQQVRLAWIKWKNNMAEFV